MPSQKLSTKLRKGKAATCGTNYTTRTSRPVSPACPAPGSGRGGIGAETRGTRGLSPHPFPSCPWWQGAQHPSGAGSGGESLTAGTVVGRLHLKGLPAHSCSRRRAVPARTPHRRWLRGARRVPGGHSGTKRGHWLSLETFSPKLN